MPWAMAAIQDRAKDFLGVGGAEGSTSMGATGWVVEGQRSQWPPSLAADSTLWA